MAFSTAGTATQARKPTTTRDVTRVLVAPVAAVGHCADCGFASVRVHSQPVSVVSDVSIAGRLLVRVS